MQSQAGVVKTQHDWSMLLFLLESIGTGASHSSNTPAWSPFNSADVDNTATALQSSSTNIDSGLSTETEPLELSRLPGSQKAINDTFLSILNTFDLLVEESIQPHEPNIFFKCCKTLSDLVRSDVHVTVANFSLCVHCVRTFSEVSSCGLALEYESSLRRLEV